MTVDRRAWIAIWALHGVLIVAGLLALVLL